MLTNQQIEVILETYPDLVADALEKYKIAVLDRQRLEAKTYLMLKASFAGQKVTESHLEAMVRDDQQVYEANLAGIKAESAHLRLYETLLSAKKVCAIREAY